MRRPPTATRIVLLGLLLVCVLPGAGQAAAAPRPETVDGPVAASEPETLDRGALADRDAEEREDDETGARVIPEWWSLGGEAAEAPYMGLVELGVAVLVVGLAGYSIGKRTSIVRRRYRRYLLGTHEWAMLAGTALVTPHFFAVEEWEGLGFLVGVLLAIEVLSGLYGRHLHRHVIRLNRGGETAPLAGRLLDVSKRSVLSRWRRIHVLLTVLTATTLVVHVVTAIAD